MTESLKLLERHSTPAKALVEPAPDDGQLRLILKTALSAPDHGRRKRLAQCHKHQRGGAGCHSIKHPLRYHCGE